MKRLLDFRAQRALRITILSLLPVLIAGGCIPIPGVSPDTVKENISIGEAQALLPFQICLPGYLPTGAEMRSGVRYHDEFGDPNESDVTIDYQDKEELETVLTIYERHGPPSQLDADDNVTRNLNLEQLIAWQVGWPNVDAASEQVIATYGVYADGSDRLMIEITSPESLRATLVTWNLSDYVLVDIYSHLSLEETRKVAESMRDCTALPAGTETAIDAP